MTIILFYILLALFLWWALKPRGYCAECNKPLSAMSAMRGACKIVNDNIFCTKCGRLLYGSLFDQPRHRLTISLKSEDASFQIRDKLQAAIDKYKKVKFQYNGHDRVVHPYFLDREHIFGWCEFRQDPRTFRIDNISTVDVLHDTFVKNDMANQYLIDQQKTNFRNAKTFMEWEYKKEHNITKETGI